MFGAVVTLLILSLALNAALVAFFVGRSQGIQEATAQGGLDTVDGRSEEQAPDAEDSDSKRLGFKVTCGK